MKRFLLLLVFATAALAAIDGAAYPQSAPSGNKQLTPEIITSGGGRRFSGGMIRLTWRPATDQLSYIKMEGEGAKAQMTLVLRDAATGTEQIVPEPAGDHHLSIFSYKWSPQGDKLLVEGGSDLWLMDLKGGEPRRLTTDPGEKEGVTFSPGGDRVAFVEANNLYMVDLGTGMLKKLTTDGNDNLMNGKLDWVYEEELLQRGSAPGYVWSPDGRKIAYLSLDDTPVPKYPLTHYISDHVTLTDERFPQPGDPNPTPGMHVVTVTEGEPRISDYPLKDRDVEYLSPDFTWTPDSKTVAFSTMNRHQTDLAAHLWDPESGADRTLVEEKDPYWINAIDAPYFLKNGKEFVWLSERGGWLHLYLYGIDGHQERQLGSGDWMIDRPTFANPGLGASQVDEEGGFVYFLSTNPDPRERQVYRVRLATGEMQRLTQEAGTHSVEVSPDGKYFIDNFSNLSTPSEIRLLKSDGTAVATLNKMKNPWADYALGTTELVTVKAGDGATLYARLVKPPGFDPAKKYPVLVDVYGGPDVQLVRNAWGVTGADDQLYAEQGYVIWCLDNRGSSGRGHAWESVIFEHMGQHEVEDQLAGISYLKSLPYIDGGRIGVHGWSYGGYMTLELLTHAPDVFKCGAAGGPVTAWKFYDSIYTERYMRTPAENPDGFRDSSPLNFADKIKGKVLLIHGTDDDNVHMQNTMNFVEALVKARVPFELYLQPGERHGFASPAARLYLSQRELDFFKANL
jgi:dipeptidyl-peptidase-4